MPFTKYQFPKMTAKGLLVFLFLAGTFMMDTTIAEVNVADRSQFIERFFRAMQAGPRNDSHNHNLYASNSEEAKGILQAGNTKCNFTKITENPYKIFEECELINSLSICTSKSTCECLSVATLVKDESFVDVISELYPEYNAQLGDFLVENIPLTTTLDGNKTCRATKGSLCPLSKIAFPTQDPLIAQIVSTMNSVKCEGTLKCAETSEEALTLLKVGTCDASFVLSSFFLLATSLLSHFYFIIN